MFSTTWAVQYWYLCLIALLIGVATGWWIWARAKAAATRRAAEPAYRPEPVPAPAPVRLAEVPPVAAPVIPLATPLGAVALPRIAAAVGAPDDLELIKGVGPKLNALLISLGVRRFDQIAAWTSADIDEVDAHLGSFKGRITRDAWVDQASYLARGDTAGFEARYGTLGSEIQRD